MIFLHVVFALLLIGMAIHTRIIRRRWREMMGKKALLANSFGFWVCLIAAGLQLKQIWWPM